MSKKNKPPAIGVSLFVLFLSFVFLAWIHVKGYLKPGNKSFEKRGNRSVTLSITPSEGIFLVKRVIDGDTIEIETGDKVRYIGIDAPELNESFGFASAKANESLVFGRRVRLEFDRQRTDDYGRILAYVWMGELLVNEKLVETGYAKVSYLSTKQKLKYLAKLQNAEVEAKQNQRGIWQENQ